MSSIQVAGHVCVDLTPKLRASGIAAPGELAEVGPMAISIGGAVGNCGRVLADLGVEVSLSAAVGDDELGAMCRRILQQRHGDAVDLTVLPGASTSYSVVVEPRGIDRSFWHHTGANDLFTADCEVTAQQLVHFGYPTLVPGVCTDDGTPIRAFFERAHQRGVATSLDLAFLAANSPLRGLDWEALFRGVLPACDVFCPSWDDLVTSLGLATDADQACVESWADRFLEWGAGVVLITMGEQGSYLRVAPTERLSALGACHIDPAEWAGTSLWMAPEPIANLVTTNGAGDAYKAAFLARLVNGASPQGCLDFARQIVARHIRGDALIDDASVVPSAE